MICNNAIVKKFIHNRLQTPFLSMQSKRANAIENNSVNLVYFNLTERINYAIL